MSRLWDIAQGLKAAAMTAWADAADPPEVFYIADGNITMEIGPERVTGPQSAVVITWDRDAPGTASGTGLASPGYITDGYFMTATFSVFVLRAAPMPADAREATPLDAVEAGAAILLDDAWRLLSAVVNGYASSEIGGVCTVAAIVSQTPVGPEGGVEGSRLVVSVQL